MSSPLVQNRTIYLVVMGVAGTGKSVVAEELARQLRWLFLEGDQLHTAANIEKMRLGVPLDDADREPWLRLIADAIDAWRVAGASGVITCSALRRRYRTIVSASKNDVWFVYLRGDRELIARRMSERRGHFMPASLLDSQFEILEEPLPPEQVIVGDISMKLETVVGNILLAIRRLSMGPG